MKFTKSVGNRRFRILVEESEGGFTGRCLELHGVVSYGKTIKELKANMKDAITLVLDMLEEAKKGNQQKESIEIPIKELTRKLRQELKGVDVESIANRVERRSNAPAKKRHKALRH